MTERELEVLKAIEQRLDTVAHLVGRLGDKVFDNDEIQDQDDLRDGLADCKHDLRAVRLLKQR